jgi:NHL repeat
MRAFRGAVKSTKRRHKPILALSIACWSGATVLFCCAPTLAARGHLCEDSFGEIGSGNGQLNRPEGVAVNKSLQRVYVSDSGNDRVEYFSTIGNHSYEGQFNGSGTPTPPSGQLSNPQAIAVDQSTGDVYVVDSNHNVVDKFTASGEYIGQIKETPKFASFGQVYSVAIGPEGNVWIDFEAVHLTEGEKHIARFKDNLGFVEEWETKEFGFFAPGLAVDSQSNVYVKGSFAFEGHFYQVVDKLSSSGSLLFREVGGELAPGWVAVEQGTDDSYLGQVDHVSRYTPGGVPLERLAQGRLTEASGIAVDASHETVYIGDLSANVIRVCTPEPPGPPTIDDESLNGVTSNSATLAGRINPRTVDGEAATKYTFEYGACPTAAECPSSGYDKSVTGLLEASFEVSPVSVHVQDLLPHTVYHLRLVASNSRGPATGEELIFTTQPIGGPLVLPDGRIWELVTPAGSLGGAPLPIGETGLLQAAAAGGAFTYEVTRPTEADPTGFTTSMQVLASRGENGWSASDLAISHESPVGLLVGVGREYRFFAEDLTSAVVEQFGSFSRPEGEHEVAEHQFTRLFEDSPEATDTTPYVRHNATCQTDQMKCYEPVVTAAAEGGDVAPETKFGGEAVTFAGATPSLDHVIVASDVALTETPAPKGGLYEWSASAPSTDRLQLVSILPSSEGGQAALMADFGRQGFARDSISSDGSRIVFTALAPGQANEHLYVRDTVRRETVRLDIAEGGSSSSQAPPVFQNATANGSKVFFTDGVKLTAGAGAVGFDLYECGLTVVEEEGKEKLKCILRDLTPVPGAGQPGAGEPAEIQGNVVGVDNNDGGHVYFVANGVQADGATLGNCKGSAPPRGQECNLYVRHADETNLIARLSSDDFPDWGAVGPISQLVYMTSRVSPNGLWFSFMSDRSLTGYDNRDATSGLRDEEVYLYDDASRRLVCASCNPTGARPVGMEYSLLSVSKGGLAGGDRVWPSSQGLAANIPGWTPFRLGETLYQSRYLSDQGRLFFNSSDGLVAQDTNGNEDVYEYEPNGVGPEHARCAESDPTFSVAEDGCIALISSGVAVGQSAFLDASASGSEVFFLTGESLVPQDVGTGLDVYDAHECAIASPCVDPPPPPSAPCESAAACRPAPMTQPTIFSPPPSSTFNGAGNVRPSPAVKPKGLTRTQKLARALKACRRLRRRQRIACMQLARKRYGAGKSHRGRR